MYPLFVAFMMVGSAVLEFKDIINSFSLQKSFESVASVRAIDTES